MREVAARLSTSEQTVSICTDLDAASSEAHVICYATLSTEPLIKGDRVAPGTHVSLIGGFRPHMRECDDALMRKASVFVDSLEGATQEAGEIVGGLRSGSMNVPRLRSCGISALDSVLGESPLTR